ncbi:MAG: serine hydroxymethyltransferase, partial [Peptostreptococcus porci]|nr:serine hydroxymethyltransferase [Peptostreptococcus porci]
EYQKNIVKNASILADELKKRGFDLVSGGTDNHLILLNLVSKKMTGKEAETLLDEAYITVNKNSIPFDKASFVETSGIRIGTPAVTSRGMNGDDMIKIAEAIDLVITHRDIEAAQKIVVGLTEKYPLPEFEK